MDLLFGEFAVDISGRWLLKGWNTFDVPCVEFVWMRFLLWFMCCPEGMVLVCCWSRTQHSWFWVTFELPTCVLHVLAASTQFIVRARWVVGSLSFPGIDFVSDFDDSNLLLQPIADALVAATQNGSLGCLSFDFFGCKRSEETCRFTRVESGPPSSFGSWDHCRHAGARCVRRGDVSTHVCFPTCQVRVVRFYQMLLLLFHLLLLLVLLPSSSWSQWVGPDLNRKHPIAVGAAGP